MKTKEQIKKYNKEYFARPEVVARAKVRNAKPEHKLRRKLYKKTKRGRETNLKYVRKTYPKIAERRRVERYGVTPEIFALMKEKQNGLCAICFSVLGERPHIDHCHSTGVVRGLLCASCNMALGLFKDDIEIMLSAIKYLKHGISTNHST